jgi:hypothetical protein
MTVGDKHSTTPETTPEDVAQWMLDELEKTGLLYQWEAILEIQSSFDGDFTYLNKSGNFAIDRRVLRAFRHLTEDEVVWRRTEGCWVKRGPHDPPGRQADPGTRGALRGARRPRNVPGDVR